MDRRTDVEVHGLHVWKVLTLMRENKMYASLRKCIFAASKILLLACIVGKLGVRHELEMIKEINLWPMPSDAKGIRKLFGLAVYLHN